MRKTISFILQLNFLIISKNLYLNNNFFHSLVNFFEQSNYETRHFENL
jgi:hypothetical protein